jgi:hypothetical protein
MLLGFGVAAISGAAWVAYLVIHELKEDSYK